jgi:gluconokinase
LSCVLAIDIGTTSTKGLVVASTGEVLAAHQEFYSTSYPLPGFAEQDPEVVFRSVVKIIKEVRQKIKSPLAGICFSGAMHSVMVIDAQGNALTPLVIWADTRSADQAKEIKSKGLAQKIYEITGTPVHPMSLLCKLMWWQEHQPEMIEKAHRFISIKEFVIFKLTGEFLVDYSTATATGLFDIEELRWSELAQRLHCVPPSKFSTPVSIYHSVESTKEVWMNELQLNSDCKIILGASDGCCAQIGSGAMGEGELSITLGTSGAVRVASKKRIINPKGSIFNYLLDESTFICGGATNNGTALLNWYSGLFDTSASKNIIEFVKETETIAAGASGLIFLPYLLGERAPIYNADARGVFFGISIGHSRLHFQRALLEGICFGIKSILMAIEKLVGRSKKIIVSGGITHSPAWLQLLSNVLGRDLIVPDASDASAMGAAMIGFKSLGITMKKPHITERKINPDSVANHLYEEQFKIFESLYLSLEKQFDMLTDLRKKCL